MTAVLLAPRTRLGVQRYDGPLRSLPSRLPPGQWASDPTRHRARQMICVLFACPECGGVDDIDSSSVSREGEVEREFICQTTTCSFHALLTLSGWGLPTFDVSDEGGE